MRDPFELEDGHAPEIALTAMADGQDEVVPAHVRAHVDQCDACATRLGVAMRESLEAHDLVRIAQPVKQQVPLAIAAVRVPWKLVIAGCAIAALGVAFDFGDRQAEFAHTLPALVRSVPLAWKSCLSLFVHVWREHGESASWIAAAAALGLAMVSAVVARRLAPLERGGEFAPEKAS